MLAAIRSGRLLESGGAAVLAVSGGADSMVMLDAMACLAGRRDTGWRLHVAHLNHHIRPRAARRDAEFVRDEAERRGLDFQPGETDVRAYAAAHRVSLEEAARECRYDFLRATAERVGASAVVTAHHADDQVETVLHHIVRGTGLAGLAGMPAARAIAAGSPIRLVRPLLELRRRELNDYATQRQLTHRIDRTNVDPRHTRNRVRRELIPLLERRYNADIGRAILRLAAHARLAGEALTAQAEEILRAAKCERPAGGPARVRRTLALPLALLRGAEPIVQAEAIRLGLNRLEIPLGRIGFERLMAVTRMLAGARGGRRIELAGGAWVIRRGREVIIGR